MLREKIFYKDELPVSVITANIVDYQMCIRDRYSQEPKTMLYCVVSSTEAKIVTRKILEADPKALINVIKTETFRGRFHQTRHCLLYTSFWFRSRME